MLHIITNRTKLYDALYDAHPEIDELKNHLCQSLENAHFTGIGVSHVFQNDLLRIFYKVNEYDLYVNTCKLKGFKFDNECVETIKIDIKNFKINLTVIGLICGDLTTKICENHLGIDIFTNLNKQVIMYSTGKIPSFKQVLNDKIIIEFSEEIENTEERLRKEMLIALDTGLFSKRADAKFKKDAYEELIQIFSKYECFDLESKQEINNTLNESIIIKTMDS